MDAPDIINNDVKVTLEFADVSLLMGFIKDFTWSLAESASYQGSANKDSNSLGNLLYLLYDMLEQLEGKFS